MHLRFLLKVVDRRRGGCGPFESPGVPWIVAGDFSTPVRNDEVVSKDQDRYSLDQSSDRHNQIEKVPSTVRLVGVDRPRHPQKSEKVHGVERDVEANNKKPEMPFAERLVQQA